MPSSSPDMSTAAELRLIADSIRMALPFQAARLHVLAGYVESLESAAAMRRSRASCATTDRRGERPPES